MAIIAYAEIRRRIGRYLGIDTDAADWTASEVSAVTDIVNKGLREFYFPAGETPHYWTFLRKATTLSLVDGTSWYDLPSDFVAMESVFSVGSGTVAIEQIDAVLLRLKIANEGASGSPLQFAVRKKSGALIYQAGFYPVPNASISAECWYIFDPGDLSDANTIPEGTADHSETIIASCLAAAEMEMKPEAVSEGGGVFMPLFKQLLASSIARDQRLSRGFGA